MGWDVILFDLDGTLTDSGPGIMKAAQYALRARLWMRSAPHERKTECRYKKY